MGTRINLGAKVKDTVTGLVGIVTMRSEHLNGCWRYVVQPPVDKDGKIADGTWIDEVSLEVLEDKKIPHKEVSTGGPSSRVPYGKL